MLAGGLCCAQFRFLAAARGAAGSQGGTLLGFNWLAMSIGSTFGPPLAGLFVDGTSFGWHAVMGCATVSLAAAMFALWLTPPQACAG